MAYKPKRVSVRELIDIGRDDLEGRVVDIIKTLEQAVEEHGSEAVLYMYSEEDNWGGDGISVESFVFRPETDEEYNQRIERERADRRKRRLQKEKARATREEHERKELERLKKKYESA